MLWYGDTKHVLKTSSYMIVRIEKEKQNRARSAQVKALVPTGTATPIVGSTGSNKEETELLDRSKIVKVWHY